MEPANHIHAGVTATNFHTIPLTLLDSVGTRVLMHMRVGVDQIDYMRTAFYLAQDYSHSP